MLAEQGHDITGVTLKLACYGKTPLSPRACCTLDAMDDARRVAMKMGFAYHVVDAEQVFKERVMMPWVDGYASGRTLYPCAACNQHLKFGDLVSRMELATADRLATGHYARVRQEPDGSWGLYRAADAAKDQTYALALIPYAVLSRVLFPLGELAKPEVRAHAQRLGLSCWDKQESQDLCFVPDGDYAGYITNTLGETRGSAPGAFVDEDGKRIGTHRGVIHYTIGQRKGLGIAGAGAFVRAGDRCRGQHRHARAAPRARARRARDRARELAAARAARRRHARVRAHSLQPRGRGCDAAAARGRHARDRVR